MQNRNLVQGPKVLSFSFRVSFCPVSALLSGEVISGKPFLFPVLLISKSLKLDIGCCFIMNMKPELAQHRDTEKS